MSVSLVSLLSTYREGPLAHEAIRSALEAEPDRCLVFEGPAGKPIPEAPATDFTRWTRTGKVIVREGEWRADAEKRTAMVELVRAMELPPPVFGVWVDGDEVLVNGRYLRDILQALAWEDEARGATLTDPDNLPIMGRPIRIIEPSGLIISCRAKVIRLDLVKRYVVSSSVVETVLGGYMGEGNKPDSLSKWFDEREPFAEKDYAFYAHPPLPCEPFLVHRSWLRHPSRRPVRMSDQEIVEFARESEARGITVGE
jgi:hypothetical protein